jgi:hypothetical protein
MPDPLFSRSGLRDPAVDAFENFVGVDIVSEEVVAVGVEDVFVRHLEEDEIGELLEVITVAHAVVAQRVAEAPDFGNDAVGGHERF